MFGDALPELQPGDTKQFKVGEHELMATAVNQSKYVSSARARYSLTCHTCRSLVHPATMEPIILADYHAREAASPVIPSMS